MAKYFAKRLGMALLTILLVACVTFLLMNAVPGSPWLSEKTPSEQTLAALNAKYGLDKPVPVQLVKYLGNLLHGDFGVSLKMQKNRAVSSIIVEMFPISAKVGALALLWAVVVGVPLGCLAAFKRGKLTDSILRVVCTVGISMPSFVVASALLVAFAGGLEALKIFPTIFDASLGWRSYVLPCFSLGFYPMCYTARQTRSAMLDSLNQEYIKTARAKGLKNKKIIFKHALRNALIPVITYLGPQVAFTLCGGFVVESVFSIPGLGRYMVQSIQNRDYPVIMGTTIFMASFVIIMNLVVDILYKVADPRISLTKGGE
ncbi:ABC transporter permease [Ruminococcus sp. 5_1_39BFAA]|uniref:ABC transporter permease n=1 Tax=Ruminococcus sp. 5_1_39BFAA TaxID=457412 RepID=UPI003566865F